MYVLKGEDENEMWSVPKCCEPVGTYNSMLHRAGWDSARIAKKLDILEEDVEDILLHQKETEAYFLQQAYFKDL